MDRIYQQAHATIVACVGNSGLPGVSGIRRKRQPAATVGDYGLVSILPQLTTTLDGSAWLTMAWTYQEKYPF
jgi:hypothetical protein